MSNSEYSIQAAIGDCKISTELSKNGDLTLLEFKRKKLHFQYKCKTAKKVKDRLNYMISGIPQLGIDAPEPLDREDLIEKEFSVKSLIIRPWVTVLVTLLAIIFDTACYLSLFNELIDPELKLNIGFYLVPIAAAMSIDILPSFLARILHNLYVPKKIVLVVFSVLSTLFSIFFILACIFGRLGLITKVIIKIFPIANDIPDLAFLQALIPIATTMLCFILSYISFDPFSKRIKILKQVLLSHTENLNELNALVEEIESEREGYISRINGMERSLYSNARKQVDAIGNHYRAYVRTMMMLKQHSPAETSDLSVFLEALSNSEE